MIKKLYYQFKRYNIKIAREKAERKDTVFDENYILKGKMLHYPSYCIMVSLFYFPGYSLI